MTDETLDLLLFMWREQYDALQEATAELQAQLDEISKPFQESMTALEKEIKEVGLSLAQSYKDLPTVEMNYRSGYMRTTFPVDAVKMTVAFLKDFAPHAANALEEAQKDTFVKPSVSVKAKGG